MNIDFGKKRKPFDPNWEENNGGRQAKTNLTPVKIGVIGVILLLLGFGIGYYCGYDRSYNDGYAKGLYVGGDLGYNEGFDQGLADGEALIEAETEAKEAEETETVYILSGQAKYHRMGCSYLENKTDFNTMTKADADSEGYSACKRCWDD